MAIPMPPNGPWTSASYPQHSIHPMPLLFFEALEAGDLERASSHAPASVLPLPSFLVSSANRGIWRRRLDQVAADPEHTPWMSRVVVCVAENVPEPPSPDPLTQETSPAVIVGRIGFHGKPDERGMLEVGYEIAPEHWRRGHAKAAMRIMVDVAREIPGVKVLKASVVEENWISRRVIEGEGLRKVGRQMHERRGLEDIFEMDVSK